MVHETSGGMETTQAKPSSNPDQLISAILDAELPLWVRLVVECMEKLTSESTNGDTKSGPLAEIR